MDDCITHFQIECSSPYATFEFYSYISRVWIPGSEDQVNAGVFYSVNEILKRRVWLDVLPLVSLQVL